MSTYRLNRTSKDRRIAKRRRLLQVRIRQAFALSVFVLSVFLVAIFFSTAGKGYLGVPSRPSIDIRTTAGEVGVSSPLGPNSKAQATASSQGAAQASAAGGVNAAANGAVLGIATTKPAWTNLQLYRDPGNEATTYASENPTDPNVAYFTRMGQVPVAQWFGDWDSNVTNDVQTYVSSAAAINAVPTLVLYNIPQRDCGGYSTGGAASVSAYTSWIKQVAAGIGNHTAVVILEPDALGALDCLAASDQPQRIQALSQAVPILKAQPNAYVYIDAGTPSWQSTTTMAARLKSANIAAADGFSINVSYFLSTASNQSYGDQLSSMVGYKHYVVDTSRNGGNHSNVTGAQCNPSWAAFGAAPTTNTGDSLNDALLWIKIPWESDGQCNGSPNAGVPYWSYAVQLAKNAGW